MNKIILIAMLLVSSLTACLAPSSSSSPPSPPSSTPPPSPPSPNPPPAGQTVKKLIELGWDQPQPWFLKQNLNSFEARGFDGVVVGPSFGTEIFNKKPYTDADVARDRADLDAAKSAKLTQNFLRMDSRLEPGWNWSSDQDWAAVETNARNFARLAKAGGFRGVLFDTEPYGQNPWAFSKALYPNKTFAQVGVTLRSRGASFMRALQSEMPDVRVLTLYFVASIRDEVESGELEQSGNALLLPFADGMLDAIGPNAQIIDGNETTYYNTNAQEFDDKAQYIRDASKIVAPENRAKYASQVKVANAAYVDGVMDLFKSPRFFGYYMNSDADRLKLLEHNIYHGLRTSDEFVWVYSESMDWWNRKGKGVVIPAGLEDAINRANANIKGGKPLGFDITSTIKAAKTKFDGRVDVGGTIRGNGKSLSGIRVLSGIEHNGEEVACATWGESGDTIRYGCTLPGSSWSGTITPKLSGASFDPPNRAYSNLTKARWTEDYNLKP
jgi:hypothetical protein